MLTAIVTGANGFVGSAIVQNLLRNNYRVFALYNNSAERLKVLPNCIPIKCSMEQYQNLPSLVAEKVDYLFHCAWKGSAGKDRCDIALQNENVLYSTEVIKAASALGVKRVIIAGSIMEDEVIAVTERNGATPSMGYIYGAAKYSAHMLCKILAVSLGVELVWGKITNAYGVGERSPRMLNTTITKCILKEAPTFTAATQNYDFVYIDDVAEAFRLLAERGRNYFQYTIGGGNARPLKAFLEELRMTIGGDLPFKYGDIPFTGVNLPLEKFAITDLMIDTGFKPKVSFSEGVRFTHDWLEQNLKEKKNDSKI